MTRSPHTVLVVAVAATLCALSGCGDGSTGERGVADAVASSTTTTMRTLPSGCDGEADPTGPPGAQQRVELAGADIDRWYNQVVPLSYDGQPAPLVIDLHGYLSGAAIQQSMSDLGSLSESAGFVLVTPQGNSDLPYWNATPEADLPDDVEFVADVIDDVSSRLCIDPSRVYVDGFSNGAFMASLVACRLADRVAAVAAVAGLMVPEDCDPSRPIPVLGIHGTDDRYVDIAGGPGPSLAGLEWNDQSSAAFENLPWAAVDTTAAGWAALDQCSPEPTHTTVSDSVASVRYDDCADAATVELYIVEGGGHTWPASEFSHASEAILGVTTDEIDASDLIWSFFSEHPMP